MTKRPAPKLNTQQVDAILIEGQNRELLEADVDGRMPDDPQARLEMAQTLVVMAQQSFDAGSRDDDVATVLFIAEVDMNPLAQQTEGGEAVEAGLTSLDDNTLVKIEQSLVASGQLESTELKQFRAEIERRGLPTPWKEAVAANGGAAASDAPEWAREDQEAERAALEDRLTFAIMRAHNIDPSEVKAMTIESLRWIIEHPEPTVGAATAETAVVPEPQGETIETTVVVPPQPVVRVPVPELEPQKVTSDRETLEEQVTGPMLKAYGRGRQDVPNLGDNELRFMIENPEGRVTKEQLDAARALDQGATPSPVPAPAPIPEEPTPHPEPAPVPAEPQTAVAAFAPPAAVEAAPVAPVPQPQPSIPAPVPRLPADFVMPPEATRDATAHFNEIVQREHLPLPQEIDQPPVMPNDMSKLSRDEIYSLHARFHACEARIGLIITNEEDALGDIEKLRRAREADAAAEIPIAVDGRKLTETQRAARIAADPQVQAYVTAEHSIEKGLRKLKVLRDSYHRDCERCSRQLTKWAKEYEAA